MLTTPSPPLTAPTAAARCCTMRRPRVSSAEPFSTMVNTAGCSARSTLCHLPQGQAALQSCRQNLTQTAPASPASAAAPSPRGSEMLGWVIQTVLADGVVSEKEQQYLHSIAQTRRVPIEHLDEMIEAAKGGSLDVAAPADRDETRAWLEAMIEAGFADGPPDRPMKSKSCRNWRSPKALQIRNSMC